MLSTVANKYVCLLTIYFNCVIKLLLEVIMFYTLGFVQADVKIKC